MFTQYKSKRIMQKCSGLALGGLLALATQPAGACTETAIKGPLVDQPGGKTQNFVSARTVDFDLPLGNKFVKVPRNIKWKSRSPAWSPDVKDDDPTKDPSTWKGKEWTNQYGFIGLRAC